MENQQLEQDLFKYEQTLPNATAVLVLGIISIVGCFCYALPGLTCGIIALVLANKDLKMYKATPQSYTVSSYNNLNAGRICAIIGTSLAGIAVIIGIIYFAVFGTMFWTALEQAQHHR